MLWFRIVFTLATLGGGGVLFWRVLWHKRLKHVWPKRGEIQIVNKAGLVPGILEVVLQKRVVQNRPIVGLLHLPLFYGFIAFSLKSAFHVLNGFLPHPVQLWSWYIASIDVFAALVLISCVAFLYRRFFVDREKLTHMAESTLVLSMIAGLMVTHLLEHAFVFDTALGQSNWALHLALLAFFPSLIAYGKHLHIMMAPVNVVLRHMTELPSDRPVNGLDFDMEDEERFDEEYARVGMPNGVSDFSFHPLFDTTACIECGRCNDACPSAEAGLAPRDHFVLALRDPALDAEGLQKLAPPDIVATCTQCRACDTVCPVGNRPAETALEMRGRYTFEGVYPPRALKTGGVNAVNATGNILGEPASTRKAFIEKAGLAIYDATEHEVLLVLGCQGGSSPEVHPVVIATGKLLDAAGIKYGVLAEEQCWGEGLLHGGGLMEDWPMYYQERIEQLTEALGGDPSRTILTVCPHCRDTIGTQYGKVGGKFTNVKLHVSYLHELMEAGRLKITKKAEQMATHHPCKVVHNDEVGAMEAILQAAGVDAQTVASSDSIPRCCGGGGGGFLWDSPAKVNKARWAQLQTTGRNMVVTACPGCHRMLNVAKDENGKLQDIATVLADRLPS